MLPCSSSRVGLEFVLERPRDRLVVLARGPRGMEHRRCHLGSVHEGDQQQPLHVADARERLHRDLHPLPHVTATDGRGDDDRALALADRPADGAAQLGLAGRRAPGTSGPGWVRPSAGPDSPASVPAKYRISYLRLISTHAGTKRSSKHLLGQRAEPPDARVAG